MGFLTDALGMVGSTLSAPGDYTRGLLAGMPGERMGGRDLLRHYGLADEEDTWANFLGGLATDVFTDPLTYAGGLLGGSAAKGIRGLIPGRAAQDIGRAASGGTFGAAAKFKEPLRDVAVLTNAAVRNPAEAAAAALPSWTHAGGVGQVVAPSTVSVPMAGGLEAVATPTGRTISGVGKANAKGRLWSVANAAPDDLAGLGSSYGGFYSPDHNAVVLAGENVGRVGRHERVHAIINNAARGAGDVNELPMMMRIPAKLRASESPFLQGMGRIGDELAAQSLQNRTTAGKLKGAASFLFNPEKNAIYADLYRNSGMHPAATALYGNLPRAFVGGGAAGGAGGNALIQALMGGGQ